MAGGTASIDDCGWQDLHRLQSWLVRIRARKRPFDSDTTFSTRMAISDKYHLQAQIQRWRLSLVKCKKFYPSTSPPTKKCIRPSESGYPGRVVSLAAWFVRLRPMVRTKKIICQEREFWNFEIDSCRRFQFWRIPGYVIDEIGSISGHPSLQSETWRSISHDEASARSLNLQYLSILWRCMRLID